MLLDWRLGEGASATWEPPGKRFARFDDWVQAARDAAEGRPEDTVAHLEHGQVVLAPGWTVVVRVADPEEAAAYGPVDDQIAVELRDPDGRAWFALVGPDSAKIVDAAALDSPTMASFLDHLESQGDNGEGLR